MKTKYGSAKCDANGYYVIVSGGKYHNKLLHRLIYEDAYKISLLSSALIHHKDGDKLNNSLDNLEMMTKSEHNKIHHTHKKNSIETIEKMRESKMRENNPMYGTGLTGYYRVYKVKKPTCKQGFTWVYEYTEDGKKRTISRVNFHELELEVKNRELDWIKIGDEY